MEFDGAPPNELEEGAESATGVPACRRCPLCNALLGTEGNAVSGSRQQGPAKRRRSSQKDELDEYLEQVHQRIIQTEEILLAAVAVREEAMESEEARKVLVRAAKTRLSQLAMTHLDVAKSLLDEERARSQAATGRPSRSD